jgi:CRP-like cAMP-binding protein
LYLNGRPFQKFVHGIIPLIFLKGRNFPEKLSHSQYGPDDYIFYEGDIGQEIYIVYAGELDIVDAMEHESIATFRRGSYFGENALVEGSERRTFSVRSRGWSDVCCLKVSDIKCIVNDFPELAKSIAFTAKVRFARLEVAINSHKVLRRAKARSQGSANVSGKKLLVVIAMFAEQELGMKKLKDTLSGEPGAPGKGVNKANPQKGKHATREEIEMMGDLRASVLNNSTGRFMAQRVFERGVKDYDWSWDWVDGKTKVRAHVKTEL